MTPQATRTPAPGNGATGTVKAQPLYRQEDPGTDAKDGFAVAIAAVADDGTLDEVIELLRDVRHGESRIFLLRALTM